jgi:hypothetical protein
LPDPRGHTNHNSPLHRLSRIQMLPLRDGIHAAGVSPSIRPALSARAAYLSAGQSLISGPGGAAPETHRSTPIWAMVVTPHGETNRKPTQLDIDVAGIPELHDPSAARRDRKRRSAWRDWAAMRFL